jgi:hypothetical protein
MALRRRSFIEKQSALPGAGPPDASASQSEPAGVPALKPPGQIFDNAARGSPNRPADSLVSHEQTGFCLLLSELPVAFLLAPQLLQDDFALAREDALALGLHQDKKQIRPGSEPRKKLREPHRSAIAVAERVNH